MKKILCMIALLLAFCGVVLFPTSAQAAIKAGTEVSFKNNVVATYDENGAMVYEPIGDPHLDCQALLSLLKNDKKKTLIIPEGKTVKIDGTLRIGNNTTIIATGATVVQTTAEKGIISHYVDGSKYNAIKNVVINGGTWKSSKNTGVYTMMRFTHGDNIKIKNATIYCNYQSHAVELIGCKNVTISKCRLEAQNNKTKSKTSVEEPLQIDLATKSTAPGVWSETKKQKYVNGQVCKNITIKNSTIIGSRGICTNYSPKEKKYANRYHKNIKITGCKVVGTSSQGICLYNTVGITLRDNTIKNKGTRTGLYADGVSIVYQNTNKNVKSTQYKTIIAGNTIYGTDRGLAVYSNCGNKFGIVKIKNNKIYTKKGKNKGIYTKDCKTVIRKGNKLNKW